MLTMLLKRLRITFMANVGIRLIIGRDHFKNCEKYVLRINLTCKSSFPLDIMNIKNKGNLVTLYKFTFPVCRKLDLKSPY